METKYLGKKLIIISTFIIGIFFVGQSIAVNTEKAGVFLETNKFYDFGVEAAKGNVVGTSTVNKFGRATDVDGETTDIWDGANSADGKKIWHAPNGSRYHSINSTSAEDNPSGTGAANITIYGLTDWNTKEVTETITLNGVTAVNTTRPYVIIHRMKVIGGAENIGYIKALAQTDNTVTAQINPTQGQTQMAIYGIPAGYCGYMTKFYFSVLKAVSSATIDAYLYAEENPRNNLDNYLVKHTTSIGSDSGLLENDYNPPNKFCGPVILKLNAIGSTNNLDVSGGFDLYIIEQ